MRTVVPTPAQIETFATLKSRLAEIAYLIAPVAPAYHRSDYECVLIPRRDPELFSIMHIANKFVVIRPMRDKNAAIVRLLKRIRHTLPAKVSHAAPQLPYKKGSIDSWRDFVDASAHEEIEQLSGIIR